MSDTFNKEQAWRSGLYADSIKVGDIQELTPISIEILEEISL